MTTLTINPEGRITLPADMRRQLGIKPGDSVSARLENGTIILESQDAILNRVQAKFAKVKGSMADELIAERRAEASRETS